MSNLWTKPTQDLLPGTSVAKNTFTTLVPINPPGEATTAGQLIRGGELKPGSQIAIEAWGVASNTATPTLQLGFYYTTTQGAAGVDLVLGVAQTTTTAMSNWEWHMEYVGRVVLAGTAGTIVGSGYYKLPTSLSAWTEKRMPETAPAAVTIDTTINKYIGVEAAWSASSASNTITVHCCQVLIS